MLIVFWEALFLSSCHELFQLQRGGIEVKNNFVISEQSFGEGVRLRQGNEYSLSTCCISNSMPSPWRGCSGAKTQVSCPGRPLI